MSVVINEASIMKKLNKFAKSAVGKKVINEHIDAFTHTANTPDGYLTDGGSIVCTAEMVISITRTFISIVEQSAYNAPLPKSVENIFKTFDVVDVVERRLHGGSMKTDVLISFNGELLPRTSLYFYGKDGKKRYTGDGIDNIVSLFDTGYSLSGNSGGPYGYWTGHEDLGVIPARRSLEKLGFMKRAIDQFNDQYGHIAKAVFSDDADGFYAR